MELAATRSASRAKFWASSRAQDIDYAGCVGVTHQVQILAGGLSRTPGQLDSHEGCIGGFQNRADPLFHPLAGRLPAQSQFLQFLPGPGLPRVAGSSFEQWIGRLHLDGPVPVVESREVDLGSFPMISVTEQLTAKRNIGKKKAPFGGHKLPFLGPDACIQLAQLRRRQRSLQRHEIPKHIKAGRIVKIRAQILKTGNDLRIVKRCFHGEKSLFQRPIQNPIDFNHGLVLCRLGIQHRLLVGGDLALPAKDLISAGYADIDAGPGQVQVGAGQLQVGSLNPVPPFLARSRFR